MNATAPETAALTCRHCRSRLFYAQMSEGGTYLVLCCANCTHPLLFSVEPLNDFPPIELQPKTLMSQIIEGK